MRQGNPAKQEKPRKSQRILSNLKTRQVTIIVSDLSQQNTPRVWMKSAMKISPKLKRPCW